VGIDLNAMNISGFDFSGDWISIYRPLVLSLPQIHRILISPSPWSGKVQSVVLWDPKTNAIDNYPIVNGDWNILKVMKIPGDEKRLFVLVYQEKSTQNYQFRLLKVNLDFQIEETVDLSSAIGRDWINLHFAVVNSNTVAWTGELNLHLYDLQKESMIGLVKLNGMNVPGIAQQVASNLLASSQYIFVTSDPGRNFAAESYIFRVSLGNFSLQNTGAVQLVYFTFQTLVAGATPDQVLSYDRIADVESNQSLFVFGTKAQ